MRLADFNRAWDALGKPQRITVYTAATSLSGELGAVNDSLVVLHYHGIRTVIDIASIVAMEEVAAEFKP